MPMSNPTFGLISEGPTDQRVLKNILIGFFNDPDLTVRPLQPLLDATDAAQRQGGWTQVLAYCRSSRLPAAFDQNEYLVIQIDTDRLNEKPFNLDLSQSVETIVYQVVEKFVTTMQEAFGSDFLTNYQPRLLFAVAVNQIECWLLPLFDKDKTAAATQNCLYKINQYLGKKKEQPINPDNKNASPKYYDQLTRPFLRPKMLFPAAEKNASFKIFIEKLRTQFSEGH